MKLPEGYSAFHLRCGLGLQHRARARTRVCACVCTRVFACVCVCWGSTSTRMLLPVLSPPFLPFLPRPGCSAAPRPRPPQHPAVGSGTDGRGTAGGGGGPGRAGGLARPLRSLTRVPNAPRTDLVVFAPSWPSARRAPWLSGRPLPGGQWQEHPAPRLNL